MDNYSCPEYGYNLNGAMTYDANKGISRIDYDQFGTPRRVQFANHSITEYVYAADGRRLKTRHRTSVPRNDLLGIYQTASLPSSETLSVDSAEYIGSYVCPNGQARRYNFDGGYHICLLNRIGFSRIQIASFMCLAEVTIKKKHQEYKADLFDNTDPNDNFCDLVAAF